MHNFPSGGKPPPVPEDYQWLYEEIPFEFHFFSGVKLNTVEAREYFYCGTFDNLESTAANKENTKSDIRVQAMMSWIAEWVQHWDETDRDALKKFDSSFILILNILENLNTRSISACTLMFLALKMT